MDRSVDPELLDTPPAGAEPTAYDWQHRISYLRLLDAETAGVAWKEVARTVLNLDPDQRPARAKAVWRAHLERAQWMAAHGYRAYLGDHV